MGGDSQSDLERRLGDALPRFGVAGRVEVRNGVASIQGNGPTVTADVTGILAEWFAFSEEQRARRVSEIARHLASERRARVPERAQGSFSLPSWLGPATALAGLVAAGAGAWTFYQGWTADRGAEKAVKAPVADYDADERERAARAARVCDATRSRVLRGAAVGPSDVEGWVVEISALRDPSKPPLATDPAWGAFVAKEKATGLPRIVWPGAPSLASAAGPETTVALLESDIVDGEAPPVLRGMQLVLTGRYVLPYFHDAMRIDYVKFASALTDALGANYAAMYARCAAGTSHHIGSWFRGPSPGGALTSLLYFIGSYGDRPDLRGSVLVPDGAASIDRAFAFHNLLGVTSAIKKSRVMTLLATENGMIAGLDDQPSTISFPFRDANRAGRATLEIARALGIDTN